jgi:hypothetical protein
MVGEPLVQSAYTHDTYRIEYLCFTTMMLPDTPRSTQLALVLSAENIYNPLHMP